MNKAQWVLLTTFAASFYGVGNIWMTQFGWRLWPYVAPGDFGAYHNAWWAMIKPVIFPVAAVAFLGAFALIWWRPAGVTAAPVWLNVGIQALIYTLTALFWGRWQAQTHFARLPDGGSGSLKEPTKGAVAGRALSRAERGGYTLTFYIWHCICRSHRYEESRRQVRPSSRHARPPHHEGRCAWTHSRLCHRAKNPADLARRTPGPAGIPLSRTSSPRIQETADGQVAAIRNRPGSQILRAHRQRSSLSQRRDCELEAPH